jgi:hypothetical protein
MVFTRSFETLLDDDTIIKEEDEDDENEDGEGK